MSGDKIEPAGFTVLRRAAQRRALLGSSLVVLPLIIALCTCAGRFGGAARSLSIAPPLIAAWLLYARSLLRTYDPAWLCRQLNAACPELDDSVELVLLPVASTLIPAAGTSPLQLLQRQRLQARLQQISLPDLRPPLPSRRIAVAWACGLGLVALAAAGPHWLSRLDTAGHSRDAGTAAQAGAGGSVLADAKLRIEPPAYTGLRTQQERSLDAMLPAGSRLQWSLTLAAQPSAAALVFHDGSRLPLHRNGKSWTGERLLSQSLLYRLQLEGLEGRPEEPLHRLDVIPDHAPEVAVRAPEKTLSLLAPDQKNWQLAFEASDDYGLGAAELSVSLAQGSGESIKLSEQMLPLEGEGDARRQRYRKTLDLAALGFARGDDLIVRLSVADRREPEPNRSRSASFMLRWPPEASIESTGVEGVVRDTLPAYFRSQRQIIIDTEALIAERATLKPDRFDKRSDELGVDQKLLRLRYGQFLGEEFENGQRPDGAGEPAVQSSKAAAANGDQVLAEFGDLHDQPEAATLLDPATQTILRLALNEMWQSEGQLRLIAPEQALPYEYKALEYIKQVQQASRIYLARVGLELPAVDETRRLSGDRTGLGDRPAVMPKAEAGDLPVAAAWDALAVGSTPDAATLEGWARQHQDQLPDALSLFAALDRLGREPDCAECRSQLQALLWPLLPAPATPPQPRAAPDVAGATYLDALSQSPP